MLHSLTPLSKGGLQIPRDRGQHTNGPAITDPQVKAKKHTVYALSAPVDQARMFSGRESKVTVVLTAGFGMHNQTQFNPKVYQPPIILQQVV